METYILRGFISYPALIDNDIGVVAPLGELSKHAATYTRETGIYKSALYQGVTLYSFDSRIEGEGPIPVPHAYQQVVLEFARHLYDESVEGRYSDDANLAQTRLEHDFSDSIQDLVLGNMVTNGDIWLPEWVSFRLQGQDNFIRLWFSDDAFRRQYGQYEYAFVPPVENLDDLHGTLTQVKAALSQRTYQHVTEAIEKERGDYPYTRLMARQFAWVGADEELLTDWTVLVYGEAGADLDRIRVALGDWIVANSSYSREEWLEILPDIFAPTEFIITPLWHRYAIPNKSVQAGIHSPLVDLRHIENILSKTLVGVGYEPQQRFENTVITTHPYKSLALLVTGSAANRDGLFRLNDHYDDYIHVSQQNPDFARMSPRTQEWIRKLSEMLFIAETLTSTTLLPTGYYRIERGGVVYLGIDIDGIMFMVVARASMHALFGTQTPIDPDEDDDDLDEEGLQQMLDDHLAAVNPHETSVSALGISQDLEDATLITVHNVSTLLEG